MFDLARPLLVLDLEAYALDGARKGYVYRLFDPHARRARDLFFSAMWEAHDMALRYGWNISNNPNAAPSLVTAQEYQPGGTHWSDEVPGLQRTPKAEELN